MSDRKITLCLGCMRQKDESLDVCPNCGYKYAPEPQGKFLLPKTILQERYIIGRNISRDSDGITYIGFDVSIEARVEVKEFFPEVLCDRIHDGSVLPKAGKEVLFKTMKSEFTDLQVKLQKFKTLSNLPRVFDIFEANGTVYAVYEKKELIKFSDYLLFSNEELSWDKIKEMFFPLLSSIATVNDAGIIHRKISPETIYVDKYSTLHIYGFCTESVLEHSNNAEIGFENGYAAPEMYQQNTETGFYSDVYSLGAVIYYAMSGTPPVGARERVAGKEIPTLRAINPSISDKVSDIVNRAMALDPLERIRSVRGFIEIINAALDDKPIGKVAETEKKKSKVASRILIVAFVLVFLGLLIGISVMLFKPTEAPNVDLPITNSSSNTSSEDDIISAGSEVESSVGGRFYAAPGLVGTVYSDINPDFLDRFTFEATYEYNDEYAEGLIVSQTPAEDEPLELYGTIKVVVSKGPNYYKIPSYSSGVDVDDYILSLIDIGYTEDKIITAEVSDSEKNAGEVVAVFLEDGKDKIDVETYSKIYVIYNAKEVSEE